MTLAEVQMLTGFMGAEISGVNLRAPFGDDTVALLQAALDRHHMLVMREQFLTIARQKSVTAAFGDLMRLPYVAPIADDPFVVAVLKLADERNTGVFGGDWHSDFSFLENPPAGSVLNAVEVPSVGGDTIWVNQAAAYRSLPDKLRDVVDNHGAIHVGKPYGVRHAPPAETRANASIEITRGDPQADREILHPSVVTEPGTGERALFLNPIYTTRFEHMSEAESAPLLAAIYRHATRPDFACRHRWRAGDLVVWNNRTTLHYATNDYDGERRLLYRTAFRVSAPV